MAETAALDASSTATLVLGALVIGGVSLVWYFLWNTSGKSGISADRIAEAVRQSQQDIEAIVVECKKSGKQWKDPTFGHDPFPGDSIGHTLELRDGERGKLLDVSDPGCVSWQPPQKFTSLPRPLGVRGDGVPTWLYSDNNRDGVVSAAEGMELSDSAQGSVGDCYFLSALAAAVHHHPDLADDLIDETYEEHGIYGVSFWLRGKWRMIWVDAYFPCYRPSSHSHRGKYRLIFAAASDRKEIWPLVVEKAFAKLAGSYEAISGGQIADALQMLTGGTGHRRRTSKTNNDTREWQTLVEQVQSDNYLVGAGSQQLCRSSAADAAEQQKTLQGIVTGHAYTIFNVYEDDDLRLIELRNPWGRGSWTGDWGSGSCPKWDSAAGRKAIAVVGSPPSAKKGRFWMTWEDFVNCFDSIDSCHMNFSPEDQARRAALREEAIRVVSQRPNHLDGGEVAGEYAYTQESADAMMAQLIAEEAAEKRKNSVGARGNKKPAVRTGAKKKKKKKKKRT